MESSSSSDIELAWVQQLEDYVQEVLRSRASRDVNALQEERTSFGEHAADVLAAKAGSWTFILSFLGVLGLWITINTVLLIRHWDPYPFILLNLVLSCLAAIQAPVIMMSQQRQATRTSGRPATSVVAPIPKPAAPPPTRARQLAEPPCRGDCLTADKRWCVGHKPSAFRPPRRRMPAPFAQRGRE